MTGARGAFVISDRALAEEMPPVLSIAQGGSIVKLHVCKRARLAMLVARQLVSGLQPHIGGECERSAPLRTALLRSLSVILALDVL